MKFENRIRQLKGGLLLVTFFAVGIFLYIQHGIGTAGYLERMGISPTFVIAGFFGSAILCGYIGYKQLAWNIACYVPMLFYTGATWLSTFDKISSNNPVPFTAPAFYSLLLALLVIDWLADWKNEYGSK